MQRTMMTLAAMLAALTLAGTAHAETAGKLVKDESFEGGKNETFVRRVGPPLLVRPMHEGATEHVLVLGIPGKPGELVGVRVPGIALSDFRIEIELTKANVMIGGENWALFSNAVGDGLGDWAFEVGQIHDSSTPPTRYVSIRERTAPVATTGMHRLILQKVGRRLTVTLDGSAREVSQPIPSGHLSPVVTHLDIGGYGEDWQVRRFRLWDLTGVDHGRPLDLRIRHYPSLSKLHVFPLQAVRDAFTLVIRNAAREDIHRAAVTLTATDRRRGLLLDIPKLAPGVYTVAAGTDGEDGAWVERQTTELVREGFVWEGNNLGIADKVFPPFEPIRVEDRTARVTLRSHRFDGLGFWESLTVSGNVSAGGPRELLAAPIRLVADGKDALNGNGAFTRKAGNRVVYEGRAEHPAAVVETRNTLEEDGCMKVELTLRPPERTERELRSLHLEIPLVDALMPLWHACNAGLRSNPAGYAPPGEGLVWRSLKHGIALNRPTPGWLNDFLPYVWLGAEERGLAWFADNDAGWILDPEVAALELHRQGGVLTLRVNLVQRPTAITQPHTIVFGLMASPAKPMPENWRATLPGNMWIYAGRVPGYRTYDWMGSQYWGSDHHFAAKYPVNRDFSILDKMQEAALTKRANLEPFRQAWAARNLGDAFPTGGNRPREQIYDLLKVSLDWASRLPGDMAVYWEEFVAICRSHPELNTFGWEWTGGHGTRPNVCRSYQDFACWYGAEFLRRGIGLYFDNTFMELAYDPATSSAYYWGNDNVQPSAGIWARREYLRRIWMLHRQLPPADARPPMILHMTNTQILPYMVWNDVNLDLEWHDRTLPRQAAFRPDLLRAEGLGRQTGNLPEALSMQHVRGDLSFFGAMMVHEMRAWFVDPRARAMLQKMLEFGYGREGCEVINYWADPPAMTTTDPLCKWLLLRNGEKLLLLVCTWNKEPATVTFAFDAKALGLTPAAGVNAENPEETHPVTDGALTLALTGYDVRLVRLNGVSHSEANPKTKD